MNKIIKKIWDWLNPHECEYLERDLLTGMDSGNCLKCGEYGEKAVGYDPRLK